MGLLDMAKEKAKLLGEKAKNVGAKVVTTAKSSAISVKKMGTSRGDGLRALPTDCSVQLTDSADMLMHRLSQVLRDNIIVLGVCALVLGGCALIIAYAVWEIVALVRKHRSLVAARTPNPPIPANNDDVVYDTDAGALGNMADLQDASDVSAIKDRMSAIKGRYAAYNKAITHYLRSKGRSTKGQVVDETILTRAQDDDDTTAAPADDVDDDDVA